MEGKSRRAEIYFDGACMPFNPGGVASYGFVIKFGGKTVKGSGIASEKGTNNIAEYTALIKALEKALELGVEEAVVKGDSQLAIRQMQGIYAVRSPNIIPLYERAAELAKRFKKIRFEWIPREENEEADSLSTKAYISFQEAKVRKRIKTVKKIEKVGEKVYIVNGYRVDAEKQTCECPFFRRMNSYHLHKRSGIKIRCKHILAVLEKIKK